MADHPKRKLDKTDPDYENLEGEQTKRQRVLEEDGRQIACKKIQSIILKEFQTEISNKESELQQVDIRLNEARLALDRLRACVVANYYGLAGQSAQVAEHPHGRSGKSEVQSIHPAVKKLIGKAPKNHPSSSEVPTTEYQAAVADNKEKEQEMVRLRVKNNVVKEKPHASLLTKTVSQTSRSNQPYSELNPTFDDRRARLKIKKKIIVGNVSKYIPVDQREANDMSSHKWMVYVRGPKSDPDISYFVKKVWFFLHHSYKPNDLVEISNPPFHLTRRGWGEFPVRVQMHFVDPRNKKVDIFHHLKLDKTFTGLQKLGGETVFEVELERDFFVDSQVLEKPGMLSMPMNTPFPSSSSSLLSSSLKEQIKMPGNSSTSVSTDDSEMESVTEKSRTLKQASTVEIKREVLSDQEDDNNLHEDSDQDKIQSTGTVILPTGNEQRMKNILIKKETEEDKKEMKETEFDNEYNVTIAHRDCEEHIVDVCDDGEMPLNSTKPVWGHSSCQSAVDKKLQGASENVKPNQTDTTEALTRTPSSSVLFTVLEQPVTTGQFKKISEHKVQRTCPSVTLPASSSSSSIQPQILFNGSAPLQSNAVNKAHRNFQASMSAANACVAKPESIVSSPKTPLAKSTNTQQLKVIDFPHVRRANASLLGASPQNIILKTAPNAQNLKVFSVTDPNSILNHNHQYTHMSSLSSKKVQLVTAMPQATDVKKNPLIVQVKSKPAPSKFVFVKPNLVMPVPQPQSQPTVTKAPLGQQSNTKKQVSLLTGLVVEPHKPTIHSSNVNSLLRPGTCSVISGLNSHGAATPRSVISPAPPGKAQFGVKVPGRPNFTNILPVKSNQNAMMGAHEIIMPFNRPTEGIYVVNKAPSSSSPSSSLVQQNSDYLSAVGLQIKNETFSFNSPQQNCNFQRNSSHSLCESFENCPPTKKNPDSGAALPLKMSAIGITKYRNQLQLYRQTVGKGKKSNDVIEGNADELGKLSQDFLKDCKNTHDLLKAALKLHPLVQANVNKLTHPYCAISKEQWESWPIGKRRASEWHRACFVLKYLKSCLAGESHFNGEKLMSTCQLVHWCRLHAFSPQAPLSVNRRKDEPSHTSQEDAEESPMNRKNTPRMTSATRLKDVEAVLLEKSVSRSKDDHHLDIDIVGDEFSTALSSVKQEKLDSGGGNESNTEWLSPTDGAVFVNESMRLRGIKFSPCEIDEGVKAYTPQEMIFNAMLEFGADILRQTVCVNAEQNSSSDHVSLKDVHGALMALPETSFCGNRFLGKEDEEESNENTSGREKEIYR